MSELTTGARAMANALVRELGYLQRIEVILVPWAGLDLDLCLISNARGDREVPDEEMSGEGVRDKRNNEVLAKRSRSTRMMTCSPAHRLDPSHGWYIRLILVYEDLHSRPSLMRRVRMFEILLVRSRP